MQASTFSETILSLSAESATPELAGGKGAGLSRLIRAGFPVPPGFVIPTTMYRAFVAANELANDIQAAEADAVRRKFEAAEIPDRVVEAILVAYRDLTTSVQTDLALPTASVPVAVRSSATAEDLPEASFAGQQDTYLNVVGEAALLSAVRGCWASLWTDRAVAYRAHQGIDAAHVSMAVVVQRMVPARAAGVLFTVNPITGDDREVVINASWGLGEALVGGRVSPDEIVVDKASGRIKHQAIGDKAVMTVPGPVGTVDVELDEHTRAQPALTAAEAAELVGLSREIEKRLGGPQDIEWAIASGRAVILQARPVTTSPAVAIQTAVPGDDDWSTPDERTVQPFDLWTHADMGERWPEPLTPLSWSWVGAGTNANFRFAMRDLGAADRQEIQWSRRFYGRVYMNEGALAEILSQAGLPTSISDKVLGSGVPEGLKRNAPLRPLRLARGLPRMLKVAMERNRNAALYKELFPRVETWVREFLERDLAEASDRQLWQEAWEVWGARIVRAIDLHADATSQAMSNMSLLDWLLRRWGGGEHLARELASGVANVRSAEMAPALWRIAQQLRQAGLETVILENDPATALTRLRGEPTARQALQALDEFLQQHGHRATVEAELRYPRWIEAPEQVISALVGYLQDPNIQDPREIEARKLAATQQTAAAVDARLGRLQRGIVHGLIARTHDLVRLRDNGQHYVVKLILPARRLCAELGNRWAQRGWTAQADDVFFLNTKEIIAIVAAGDPTAVGRDLRTVIADRRAAYEHWFRVTAPEVVGPDGQPVEVEAIEGESEHVLVGIPASGGRVRGVARIAFTPQEAAQLQHGEILIARSTDPGWTPAFALVSGLVLEVGGQLSHGAIVAREYGLPAVLNVRDATRRIRAGQTITVDGTIGRIYLEPPAPL